MQNMVEIFGPMFGWVWMKTLLSISLKAKIIKATWITLKYFANNYYEAFKIMCLFCCQTQHFLVYLQCNNKITIKPEPEP